MMTHSYFITGSYTEPDSPAKLAEGKGLSLYKFDNTSGRCDLKTRLLLRNPSYPRYFKETGKIYAAEELAKEKYPVLASIEWNGDDELTIIEKIDLPASDACHLDLCGDDLVIANYSSADVAIYNLRNRDLQFIKHAGKGIDPDRQEAAHPHMIYAISKSCFFVADLGLDKILVYECDANRRWKSLDRMALTTWPGSGPRHLIVSNDQTRLIVVGELLGNVLLYTKSENSYQLVDEVRLTTGPASTAAIRMHPSENFFYVSERGSNQVFLLSATDSRLHVLNSFDCRGDIPRDISIDPSGRWLLVSNQDSNAITVFRIDSVTGNLEYSHSVVEDTPVSVSWLQ
jgi:6-phosphogluconolactonase